MNDKEVREMLENEKVPEKLEPENIKKMLDEKAPAVKRKRITAVSRFAAVAAACAVVSGTAVHFAGKGNNINKSSKSGLTSMNELITNVTENITSPLTPPAPAVNTEGAYMAGAENYGEIYSLIQKANENYQKERSRNNYAYMTKGGDLSFNGVKTVEEEVDYAAEPSNDGSQNTGGDDASGAQEHSDTFNQEEGVLEADIVKTDGRNIYKLNPGGTYYYSDFEYCGDDIDETTRVKGYKKILPSVSIVGINSDGSFGEISKIELTDAVSKLSLDAENANISARQMYLYNDMVIVIGTYHKWNSMGGYADSYAECKTFAAAFSTADGHRLIGTYIQDGRFDDVRIAPDGFLYLVSNYSSQSFSEIGEIKNYNRYIPGAGMAESYDLIAPDDILMPEESIAPSDGASYTVIGSLDLNSSESITPVASKALAGYSGELYCSANNLYTAVYNFYEDLPEEVEYGFKIQKTTESEITRIAIGGGQIVPAASGKVAGAVNDQFSMSEYNGYFRIATTCNEYELTYKKGEYYEYYRYLDNGDYEKLETPERKEYGYFDCDERSQDNRVYVLDMDLQTVGSIGGFGEDESVRSVNFSGDMAYVVTYEQTDPLFAIDLSDPTSPKILDEYKMLGYSSYMQRWSEDLLLGFGPDADSNGRVIGIKMVMFDNSDPNDLKEVGKVALNSTDYDYIYSTATNDRKALLIEPEKNIIAFPTTESRGYVDYNIASYKFYSYADGKFTHKGDITLRNGEGKHISFQRALYIGDHVYAVASDGTVIAADTDTIKVTGKVKI